MDNKKLMKMCYVSVLVVIIVLAVAICTGSLKSKNVNNFIGEKHSKLVKLI